MPITKRPPVHISIEATFGSEIQQSVGTRTLRILLESWKANIEASHKKNIITIIHGKSKGGEAAS
jgi:acetyl-CoA carboxylase carboxyltransferase component